MLYAILFTAIAIAVWGLYADRRQRRINRQLAVALPERHETVAPQSLRRQMRTESKFLRLAFRYEPDMVYQLPIQYLVILGIIVGLAVIWVGLFVEFSPVTSTIVGCLVGWQLVRMLMGWQYRRQAIMLFRQLPDVVELVTSSVRAGLPVTDAFRNVAAGMPEPTRTQMAIVCSQIAAGTPAEDALEGVQTRTGVVEYGIFAVTLAVQLKTGGRLSETLQTLGDTVRQRVALAGRAKALAGEVIFSARALSASPLIIGALLYLTNPKAIQVLFSDPRGHLMLVFVVTSIALGTLIIQWMIRRGTTL